MINIDKDNFNKLKNAYVSSDIELASENIRKAFNVKGEDFCVFTTIAKLDTMVILHDDGEKAYTRYLSFSKDENKNYLVLSASRTVEEMRFDAACMLRKLAKQTSDNKKSFCFNYTTIN